jgi:hypothetical protein
MSVGGYDLADPAQTTTPALPIPGYLWPGPFYLNRSTRGDVEPGDGHTRRCRSDGLSRPCCATV